MKDINHPNNVTTSIVIFNDLDRIKNTGSNGENSQKHLIINGSEDIGTPSSSGIDSNTARQKKVLFYNKE
ncbi:hypothetical protein AYI68_g4157 [Smittium mucronatum]|uniref:Uncharacterized protein n=1 Tax=Smittium mucronatum TaxID=133383 RepID=A0A1R0GY20_9FUNG|nr:hypothetical protein AYI68_g4157 [Smittium mucronatum]